MEETGISQIIILTNITNITAVSVIKEGYMVLREPMLEGSAWVKEHRKAAHELRSEV